MTRTLAVYQAAGVQGGGTAYYELARVVYADGAVTIDARGAQQKRMWLEQGVPSTGGRFIKPSAGLAFLDAVRTDMEKGGRIFALDSGRGDDVPPSLFEVSRAAEFNPDQQRDERGRWVDAGGWGHTGIEWQQPTDPKTGRPIPIKVKTVEEAASLVLQGKVVEVDSPEDAYTLIDKLAAMGREAEAKGKDAPQYDLCQISVAKTNMFCAESLRTKEFPEGIPRVRMPQLGGVPVAGSEAAKLPKDQWGKVEGAQAFVTHLQGLGVSTSREVVRSDSLRASQRELIGQKVAATMHKMEEKREGKRTDNPKDKAIFISSDDYVVDGHHRWAASVAKDAADGFLGDSKMHVVRVNAPISEVLHLANAWSEKFGIQQAAGVTAQAKRVRETLKPKTKR